MRQLSLSHMRREMFETVHTKLSDRTLCVGYGCQAIMFRKYVPIYCNYKSSAIF